MTNASSRRDRSIRVFVSSTFRDMQEDRDYLVKFVFPRLRKLCESRGVTWGEVDLRWGITDEETSEGKVLPLCLHEINRCQPYFIGLLGERYGWVPKREDIPDDVLERHEWLMDHPASSVTELEIIHGVLRDKQMHRRAFFYFRDANYSNRVPEENRRDFVAENPVSAAKLSKLKQKIRAAGDEQICRLRENYSDPETLGEWVLADFSGLIEELFPQNRPLDELDREAAGQEAFAGSRTRVYIARQEYFDRLDAHVAGDGPPLVVLGESGLGKSALLANWFLKYRANHPDRFALIHFVGSTPDSADATHLMQRVMLELKRHFEESDEVPVMPDKIRDAFPRWLASVAGADRILLIFDALNQLEDRDVAPDLGWLPKELPPNCRMILSTLPGRALEAVRRRQWLELTVEPLTVAERQELLVRFLEEFGRRLSPSRTRRIAMAKQTANPLFLRAMLDELRQFGEHERLDERIEHYLGALDPEALYARILERWEDDYGNDLVRRSLSLLWAARRGLSETELLDLLGNNGQPLPHARWTPFYLAAEPSLVQRSGLLGFFHDYLRMAVELRFLSKADARRSHHRTLAEYFRRRKAAVERQLDELPWHWEKAEEWGHLKNLLSNFFIFQILRSRERWKHDLQSYWMALAPHFDACDVYQRAETLWERDSDGPEALANAFKSLAAFHRERAESRAAETPLRRALGIVSQLFETDHPVVADMLNDLAQLLLDTNRLEEAEPLLRRALAIDEQSQGAGHRSVARDLSNLACLLLETNRLEEAESLFRRALAIDEQQYGADHSIIGGDLGNLAQLLQATNRPAEAEVLMRRALAIGEQSFGTNHPEVAIRLSNLACLLVESHRLKEAEPYLRRALAIDVRFYGADHPEVATDLNNLAQLLQATNRLEEAEPRIRRALAIDERSFGAIHPNVARSLNNLACLLRQSHRLMEAEPLMRRALDILEASYGADHPKVATGLNNLAQLLTATNRRDKADPLLRRALHISEESYGAEHPHVARSLNNLARLLEETNRPEEAEPLYRRALAIYERSLGADHPIVARDLNNLAMLVWELGRADEAEPISRRAIALWEQSLGASHPNIAAAYSVLTRILRTTGRQSDAVAAITLAVGIVAKFHRETGDAHPFASTIHENFRETLREMDYAEEQIERQLIIATET